jgi:hypothetical protein
LGIDLVVRRNQNEIQQPFFIFLKHVIGNDNSRMGLVRPVWKQEVDLDNVSLVEFHKYRAITCDMLFLE